jgi:hypothetical protein
LQDDAEHVVSKQNAAIQYEDRRLFLPGLVQEAVANVAS